ncbi:hypothetical protein LCM23_06120 [Cytobacillus kochii]|uniref:hypothetical protein n=1 Tax=Cytobacillus kochii TaxID=859143 RepID=UPI001CD763D0|nr:hypothetical protein [Cytobacillus kochii]MCA1025660.1 hypothetical protein [Cytobacillus kochii]
MLIWLLLGLIIIGAIVFSSRNNKKPSPSNILIANQIKIDNYLKENELDSGRKFMTNDFSNGIAYDEKTQKFAIISKTHTLKDGSFSYKFNHYSSSQLIESEVVIDNQSIYKTVRSSQLIGAAVGGAVFGGVGAIIGGLSGNKSKEDKIKSIQLKLTIDDLDSPSHKIDFLSNVNIYSGYQNKNGYLKDSSEVRTALNHIEKWQGIMDIILKQQNKASI